MVIDSSAVIAILFNEPEAAHLAELIERAERRLICSISYLESSMVVLSRKGSAGLQLLQAFMFRTGVEEIGFSPEQSIIAIDAYRRFGKGRHKASLNLGDCCSYALAKSLSLPIIFKGDYFSQTDLLVAT